MQKRSHTKLKNFIGYHVVTCLSATFEFLRRGQREGSFKNKRHAQKHANDYGSDCVSEQKYRLGSEAWEARLVSYQAKL